MIKLDMQVHSFYSFDSLSSPESIAEAAIRKGLNGFSITDHNVFCVDYDSLRQKYPELIIVPGMEIGTELGDILLYFINTEIKTRNAEEAIELAHEQGGIAILAHPFQRRTYDYPSSFLQKLDGIETRNSRNCRNSHIADELANKYGKCISGGSDAHFAFEVGNAYTVIDIDISLAHDMDKLKNAILSKNTLSCIDFPSWTFMASQLIRFSKKIGLFANPT